MGVYGCPGGSGNGSRKSTGCGTREGGMGNPKWQKAEDIRPGQIYCFNFATEIAQRGGMRYVQKG